MQGMVQQELKITMNQQCSVCRNTAEEKKNQEEVWLMRNYPQNARGKAHPINYILYYIIFTHIYALIK